MASLLMNYIQTRVPMKESHFVTGGKNKATREIKEWQAIMDHLRSLPVKDKGELPIIPVDARATEVRAINVG